MNRKKQKLGFVKDTMNELNESRNRPRLGGANLRQSAPAGDEAPAKRSQLPRWLAGLASAVVVGVLAVGLASGDKIVLEDGTELEGTIEPIGSGSFVKIQLDDGGLKMVAASKISSVDGQPYGEAAGGGDGATVNRKGLGKEFKDIEDRTARVNEPVKAVDLWERFLTRKNLTPAEKTKAEAELKVWKKRYTDGAELIRGAWVGGDEIKEIKDKARELVQEAQQKEAAGMMPGALRAYREALSLYPNSFVAHYRLGFIKFHQGFGEVGGNPKVREARRHVLAALKLQPDLPAVQSSMGACLFALRDYEKGTELMWEAAQQSQSELVVGNLLFALDTIPSRWLRNNRTLREINIAAEPLRTNFSSNGTLLWIEDFAYGTDRIDPDAPDAGPPGLRGNGSGFFVTEDGYVITNRHVAETDDGFYYRVRLSIDDEDGVPIEYPARFIASDDEYDIALLKIELPEGETVEYFHLLQEDVPPIQSDVMTAGYPTVGTGEFVFQTARGTVSSNDTGDENFDIYLDMKTTQGNSGGPIFDRNGHVIGITTAYRKVFDSIVSLAVGPRQIRDFLSDVDEAPELDYESDSDRDFSPVELAAEVQPKTVLVLIFAGDADDIEGSDDEDDSDEDELDEEEDDEDEGPSGPAAGGTQRDQIR